MEHTNLPLKISEDYGKNEITIVDNDEIEVCDVCPIDIDGEDMLWAGKKARRRAEFIVKACNSYDELVGALRRISGLTGHYLGDAPKIAKQALAEAKGE